MRKKIIKFYFFKTLNKLRYINHLGCFSKRAFYFNRKLRRYRINKYRFFKKNRIKIHNYSFYLNQHIITKQWIITTSKIINQISRSFFFNTKFFKKSKKYSNIVLLQIYLYFFFKNKFSIFLKKYLSRYYLLGVLSSYVSHTLVRKNLSYQSWSKYCANLYNMNIYNEWLYKRALHKFIYSYMMLHTLYNIELHPSSKTSYYDTDFNFNQTENISSNKNSITNFGGAKININYTQDNINFLVNNNDIIEKILSEFDHKKHTESNIEGILKTTIHPNIIFSRFFIFYREGVDVRIYATLIIKFIQLYHLFSA